MSILGQAPSWFGNMPILQQYIVQKIVIPAKAVDPVILVYRYIELNPVRAEMVADPGEYRWSSYQVNALGEVSELCTPHEEYLSLGKDLSTRQKNYRNLFSHHIDGKLVEEIRDNTYKGMAVGNDRFKDEIEVLTGRRLKSKKRGRPEGWRKSDI